MSTIRNILFPGHEWQITAESNVGVGRKNNEDCVFFTQGAKGSIAILADGVGGHKAGEVASQFVCEKLNDWFETKAKSKSLAESTQSLKIAIELVHQALYQKSMEQEAQKEMATTLAMALQYRRDAIIAWAGDSRIYLCRKGKIKQLSTDHSLIQEEKDQGLLSSEEAEHHPLANVITSCLGVRKTMPHLGLEKIRLRKGDQLLIVSDGISDVLDEKTMLKLVDDGVPALINAALQAQSSDNCSGIIIKVS